MYQCEYMGKEKSEHSAVWYSQLISPFWDRKVRETRYFLLSSIAKTRQASGTNWFPLTPGRDLCLLPTSYSSKPKTL